MVDFFLKGIYHLTLSVKIVLKRWFTCQKWGNAFLVSNLPYVIGVEELNPFGQLSSVCTKKLYFYKSK